MTPNQVSRKHMDDIRRLFAGALSTRLGRPMEAIRDEGLFLPDFPHAQVVEIALEDRSTMSLRHAFVVTDLERRLLGVFSEHCGYHFFPLEDTVCREVRDGVTVATYGGQGRALPQP